MGWGMCRVQKQMHWDPFGPIIVDAVGATIFVLAGYTLLNRPFGTGSMGDLSVAMGWVVIAGGVILFVAAAMESGTIRLNQETQRLRRQRRGQGPNF